MGFLFLLLYMLYKGLINRVGLVILYVINLSFYSWNPFIIHEPQPLTNIFLLSFLFLPINSKHTYDHWIKNVLIIFLGVYYLLAGIKKLPDPNFLNGTATGLIMIWPIMAKNLNLNIFLNTHFNFAITLMNYLTLHFEISFLFLVYTRFRIYLILFGVIMHSLIYITLEVGNFSFVMLLWYLLLMDERTILKFKESVEKIKILLKLGIKTS
jgi:hypothetical protein